MEKSKLFENRLTIIALTLCALAIAMVGTAEAKSVYIIANHHTAQFDSYNIEGDGTITSQVTHNLSYATDPSGMAIWVDPNTPPGSPPEGAIFITSEFSLSGVEFWDAKTMTYLGTAPGANDLAGIDVDGGKNLIYAVARWTDDLYIYSWDPINGTTTLQDTINLPNCSGAFGIALDETTGTLWVADSPAGVARAYDVNTWTEDTTKSFTPSHFPIDIEVDTRRGVVYTVSMSYGAWTPSGAGSNLLSKYDLATQSETTGDLGCHGVGVSVDESSGYVYVTVSPRCTGQGEVQVWDASTTFWNRVQAVTVSGSPAGIVIGNIGYNPLNLAKNDTVQGHGVYIGQTFTYEITYDNAGNAFDVTNVTAIDELPVELDFVSETLNGVPGTGVYDSVAHTVSWDIGTLPAGYTGGLIELVVRVNQDAVGNTTIYNYCKIESAQTGPTGVHGVDPDNPVSNDPGTHIIPAIPMECFEVNHMMVMDKKTCGAERDKIIITGSLKLAEEGEFNPESDIVTVTINGQDITIPAGSFVEKDFGGIHYYFKGDVDDVGVVLDLSVDKRRWAMGIFGKETGDLVESSGADVGLSIGLNVGEDSYEWTKKLETDKIGFAQLVEWPPIRCCASIGCSPE